MFNLLKKMAYTTALVTCFTLLVGSTVFADEEEKVLSGPALNTGAYTVTINADSGISKSENGEEVLKTAYAGEVYQLLEDMGNGYLKVSLDSGEAYISVENVTIVSVENAEVAKNATTETEKANRRKRVADYALSFVGARYRFGGSSPAGFDCSGFTNYVLKNSIGVSLLRSSVAQATQGRSISADEMKPGDLIFYGGSGISHVGVYIGDGKIVHASSEKTGVKVSPWNYRAPIRIKNVID